MHLPFSKEKKTEPKNSTPPLEYWNAKGYFDKVSVDLGRLLPYPERFKTANIALSPPRGKKGPGEQEFLIMILQSSLLLYKLNTEL